MHVKSLARWMGLGAVVAIGIAGILVVFPAIGMQLPGTGATPAVTTPSASSTDPPNWNTGNLCTYLTTGPAPGDVQCTNVASHVPYALWWNFSAGEVEGGIVNVTIKGSYDCIYLNFHSFDTTINIFVTGSHYACPPQKSSGCGGQPWTSIFALGTTDGGGNCGGGGGGSWITPLGNGQGGCGSWLTPLGGGQCGCGQGQGSGYVTDGNGGGGNGGQCGCGKNPSGSGYGPAWNNGGGGKTQCKVGIFVAVNSEGDILNLIQCGSDYGVNVTVYGTTTVVNGDLRGDFLNDTVTWIGTTAGFSTCPSGITTGRVSWGVEIRGSHDEWNTIFVDGTNVAHVPPNSPFTTEPLGPPDGVAHGQDDLYGSETTTTAPAGSCAYLAP